MASTPPASDTDDAPASRPEPRFFQWIRSLGLVRRAGWLGGVCAAIADRTRLDPILVRGIVVVIAVLGAPAVLLYAGAWLLLPDGKGSIHALTLARGRVEGAVVAIAALALLSFLPLTQGFWWAGASYWGVPDFAGSAGRVVWTGVVILVAVGVVVWLARRAAHPDTPATASGAAAGEDRSDAGARAAEFTATSTEVVLAPGPSAPAAPDSEAPSTPEPAAPPPPPAGASDAELTAWRDRQELWRHQRAAWVAQQRSEDRARRAAAQAAWAQERETRLAEHRRREPWVGGAVIGIVFGLAVVVGCAVGLIVGLAHPDRATGWTAGLAAAAVVFGLALAIAGLARRRAGGLAALAILTLLAAVGTAPLAADRVPLLSGSIDTLHSGRYAVMGGETGIAVFATDRAPGTTVDVWQRMGGMQIRVASDQTVRVIAALGNGELRSGPYARDGDGQPQAVVAPTSHRAGSARYDLTVGSGTPDVTIRVTLVSGSLELGTDPSLSAESTPAPTPSPTLATEGARP